MKRFNQDLEDKQLIQKVKSGDSRSFRMLYDKYVSDLWNFVFRWLKSAELADDIVQDTFFRLWTHRSSLDETRSVKSYLFTISYHQLLKEIKRQIKNPLIKEYFEFVSHLQTPGYEGWQYDYDTFIKHLTEAKEKLTPRQREIFELSKEDGLPVLQIALKLSIQEQVVRNQLSAAIKKIRDYLNNKGLE